MKTYKKVTIPAKPETTTEVEDNILCDICKSIIAEGAYETNEVIVSCDEGTHYPEMTTGEKITVDLCSICFKTKLIPWLKEQGVEPEIVSYWY